MIANIKSSKKRILINILRNKINNRKKSIIKTYIKKLKRYIKIKNKKKSIYIYCCLQSILDKFSCKNFINLKKASRYKSNYIKLINKLDN